MVRTALRFALFFSASAAFAVSPATISVLPSAGKGQGVCIEGVCSQWVTSAWVLNPSSTEAHVTIAFLERNKDNSSAVHRDVTVPAGQTLAFPDIMDDPFGMDGVFGALGFVSDIPVIVTGRIFDANVQTNKGQGSAGQFLAGIPVMASIGTGQSTEVFGLAQDAGDDWRTNVGFVEVTGHAVTVLAQRLAGDGTVLATRSYSVLPFEAKQFNIDAIGGTAGLNQRVRFSIISGDGRIIAFGSRVDNASGDPSTAEMAFAYSDPAIVAGQWSGFWVNSTFGSSGTASMTITWDPATQVMQATIDIGGNAFGGSNPPPQTVSATLGGRGFTFSQSSAVFGQLNVTIGQHGRIDGGLTGLPVAGISSVDVYGNLNQDVMAVMYVVNFAPSGSAEGLLFLAHQ